MTAGFHGKHDSARRAHYLRLLWMALLSFIAMYGLMYAMVDRLGNVLSNFNQAYMAGLMALPMVIIELLVMRSMYADRRLNVVILAACVVGTLALWFAIREQAAIGERQFLRSMIPHHAGAILMCQEADLVDPEALALCRQIVDSQVAEIEQMKAMLAEH
ncbi:MAG TPA: DUF305 domain-containing protein [Vicinamibacterales bacterium]|nr:DUF305 domain-containing protein [Vicinamibacterales bacterium]